MGGDAGVDPETRALLSDFLRDESPQLCSEVSFEFVESMDSLAAADLPAGAVLRLAGE